VWDGGPPAVRQQCSADPYYARTLTWCKVALLAEAVTVLPGASWYLFADADVLLHFAGSTHPPLHLQPDIKVWLEDKSSAIFAAKEVSFGRTTPALSFYLAENRRNQPTNTNLSTHLLIVKPHAAPLLSYYYCLAERCNTAKGGAGCYRVDWSHEQYLLDYLPQLGIRVGMPQRSEDYNGNGLDHKGNVLATARVRHFFYKFANDMAAVHAEVARWLHAYRTFLSDKEHKSPRPEINSRSTPI